MNDQRVERVLRELHTYPLMPAWVESPARERCRGRTSIAWSIAAASVLLAMLVTASPVLLAHDGELLVIRSVTPELRSAVLRIEGSNLTEATVVHLDGIAKPLSVVKADSRSIVAQLPADIPWANYLVRVTRGSQSHQMPVDIGIVGPVVQDN